MGQVTVTHLLRIYEIRQSLHDDGTVKAAPAWKALTKSLVGRLSELDGDELIEIDVNDADGCQRARFIRVATGEVLAELQI